jgi:hypothetical protein
MPGPVIAAAAAVGISALGSHQASKASKSASRAQSKSDKAALAFEQRKYNDWRSTYGDIENNLSSYYESLTPDYYATQGLEAFKKERATQMKSLRETLVQRGLWDSGISVAVEKDNAFETAKGNAQIRAEAPSKVAGEKFNFLQAGLGLNPGDSMSQMLQNKATRDSNTAENTRARAAQSAGDTTELISSVGLKMYGVI